MRGVWYKQEQVDGTGTATPYNRKRTNTKLCGTASAFIILLIDPININLCCTRRVDGQPQIGKLVSGDCRFAAVKILQRILCAFVDAAQMEHCAVIRRILPTEDLQKSIALRRTVILRCAPYIQLRLRLGERIKIL